MHRDPDGIYARLGLDPSASAEDVAAAYRRAARRLHPDIPGTGDVEAFLALKAAYDILADPPRRRAYDQAAEPLAPPRPAPELGWFGLASLLWSRADAADGAAFPGRWVPPWLSQAISRGVSPVVSRVIAWVRSSALSPVPSGGLSSALSPPWSRAMAFAMFQALSRAVARLVGIVPRGFVLWVGFLFVSAVGAAWLMVSIASGPTEGLPDRTDVPRPAVAAEAPRVLPLARLAGSANFYVLPGMGTATVWHQDAPGAPLRAMARLEAFAPVDVLGTDPAQHLAAILLAHRAVGFVAAARLTKGGRGAARHAYCADRAGTPPRSGEVLARRGAGGGRIEVVNKDLEPSVVKLRGPAGMVVRAVYLEPGRRAVLRGLPGSAWTVEFAAGELWSRACGYFAAGERAERFRFPVGTGSMVPVPPDLPARAMPVDIPDRVFARP